MKLAYTTTATPGKTDQLLREVAVALEAAQIRLQGTVQINTDCPAGGACDMDLMVLPDGPRLRISQSLGAGSSGCRLNPEALETAVAMVAAGLDAGADCLIINKFGKHEAEGRGFRDVIAEALAKDIPVLIGVNAVNQQAFIEFAGDMAVRLAPDVAALVDWIRKAKKEAA